MESVAGWDAGSAETIGEISRVDLIFLGITMQQPRYLMVLITSAIRVSLMVEIPQS
jgi:hypothetical protein